MKSLGEGDFTEKYLLIRKFEDFQRSTIESTQPCNESQWACIKGSEYPLHEVLDL